MRRRAAGWPGCATALPRVDGRFSVDSPPRGPTTSPRGVAVRVVIAEDSVLLREGLSACSSTPAKRVVAAVGDGDALVARRRRAPPGHRGRRRADAADVSRRRVARGDRDARRSVPGTAVLVLSQYVEERYAIELLASASRGIGYLLKDRVADVA